MLQTIEDIEHHEEMRLLNPDEQAKIFDLRLEIEEIYKREDISWHQHGRCT